MKKIHILFLLAAFLLPGRLKGQPLVYSIVDIIEMPPELNPDFYDSCRIRFSEQWTIRPSRSTISKEVESFEFICSEGITALYSEGGPVHIKNVTYEFSFMDPHDVSNPELQEAIIDLVDASYPVNKLYNMPAQLLSVYFHEEWTVDADSRVITKTIHGITPVIWQKRQTTDREAVVDAETGLPVYYKLELQKIDIRNP